MKIKKLNRNAFNEKIIHRYLFERLYFGDSEILKKLLPDHLYGKRGELADAFANSVNHGSGTPVPITNSKWETLIDKLRLQKEK